MPMHHLATHNLLSYGLGLLTFITNISSFTFTK